MAPTLDQTSIARIEVERNWITVPDLLSSLLESLHLLPLISFDIEIVLFVKFPTSH